MEEITLYTTPTCPWCGKLKDYLEQRGVDYQEIDVSEDTHAANEMVEVSGQRSVPVLVKGERYVIGYDPDSLERMLQ